MNIGTFTENDIVNRQVVNGKMLLDVFIKDYAKHAVNYYIVDAETNDATHATIIEFKKGDLDQQVAELIANLKTMVKKKTLQ